MPSVSDTISSHQNYLFAGTWNWFDEMKPSLAPEYQYNSIASKHLLEVFYLYFHAAHPILLPIRHATK